MKTTQMELPINRTIVLPIDSKEYNQIIDNKSLFKTKLNFLQHKYPEIFPISMSRGFRFVGYSKNDKKLSVSRRIIRIKNALNSYEDYLLHPCFILPYLRGSTIEIAKGLLLRKYNTPYHAISSVLGKNAMFWYRAEIALAQYNLVGTTVKKVKFLPLNLLIDEHHTKLGNEKIYLCTTVGNNCFLGVGISSTMHWENLKKAYGYFKVEALKIMPTYKPQSVNIDGYKSTKKAATELYNNTPILRCFLHSFIKIRSCGTKAYDLYFEQVATRVWHCYTAENKRSFAQRISNLRQWTEQVIPNSPFKNAILKLCEKKRIYGTLRLFGRKTNFQYVR